MVTAPEHGRHTALHDEGNRRVRSIQAVPPNADPAATLDILLAERKAAEAALVEANQRYHSVINAMAAAVYTTDVDGRLTLYNEAAARLWGRRPTLGDARFCGAWKLYTADGSSLPHEDCPMAVSLREKRSIFGQEAVAERPDGTLVPFAAYPSPLRDEAGVVVGAVNVLVDITERKAAEAALRRSDDHRQEIGRLNQNLEARIRDEVLAREAAQHQLAQARRMEALGRLAGGIAHDFNNVLQALQSTLTLIEARAADVDSVSRYARTGLDVAERGISITQRLLMFSRRGELSTETIDLHTLLTELAEGLLHTLGAGIALNMETTADVPSVTADKGQLETVLINLATNARDAMPGGGTLTFIASAETIVPGDLASPNRSLRPGRYVRIDVVDTGVGMDAATLARVSEPFFTTKAIGKGTGLGMAMARGFAEQSGGSIHIISEPGRGTHVMLWLPVVTPVRPGTARTVTRTARDPSIKVQARLLLVDDDTTIREMLSEQLELEGFDLVVAGNGSDALNLLDEDATIALLVSDLSMPEMDGLTLIKEAQRRRSGLPAILLTGHAEDAAMSADSERTRQDFSLLRKPITAKQLVRQVERLLEAKRDKDDTIVREHR